MFNTVYSDEPLPESSLSPSQLYAIPHELAIGVRLVLAGLHEARADNSEPQEHVTLLLLSQGYERILKVALCLREVELTGRVPKVRAYGHRVGELFGAVRDPLVLTEDPLVFQDVEYLDIHPLYPHLFYLLDEWGDGGRYFNLDSFLHDSVRMPQDRFRDPRTRLREIGLAILTFQTEDIGFGGLEGRAGLDHALQPFYRQLVGFLQRPARLLARGFSAGAFGSLGRFFAPSLDPFQLANEDLGTIGLPIEVDYEPVSKLFFRD